MYPFEKSALEYSTHCTVWTVNYVKTKNVRYYFGIHLLKSVKSILTLVVRSLKFGQAKAHFLSHVGEKKRKNIASPGFEPMLSRS